MTPTKLSEFVPSPSPLATPAETAKPAPPSRRVLLADDCTAIREALGVLLTDKGYEIRHAAEGREVVECLLAERVDLLLLDLTMPGLDGWDTLRRVAMIAPELPVIVITAHTNQREFAAQAGARALLEKPLDLPLLLETVRELLEPARPARRGRRESKTELRYAPPRPASLHRDRPGHGWGLNE